MLKRSSRVFVFILGLMAFGSQGTQAQVLYAADGADGNLSNLYILNAATGAVSSTVGPIGFGVTGLAFHPITGELYGVTTVENSPPQPQPSLIKINPATGAGTLIGPLGPVGCLVPPASSTQPVTDITFRADGTLFGWSRCTDDLVTINLATGLATVVADSGLTTSGGDGIAFSPTGTLYFAGSRNNGPLRTINPATGLPTTGPTLNGGPAPTNNPINALAFNNAGVLFGSLRNPAHIVTIDTTTGLITDVGSTVPDIDAIAFGPGTTPPPPPSSSTPVPTLSQWSIIALGLLIVGSVLLRRRV